MAEAAFTDPKKGGIPADVGARTKVTVATLGLEEFEKRGNEEAEKFFADFETEYGGEAAGPVRHLRLRDDELALDTLEAVGDKANDRKAVAEQLVDNTKGRNSVLGTYDIDENGDTTLTDYGLYTIEDGQLDVRAR